MRRVEKWSFRYELIRTIARMVYRSLNKHITVNGLENIPHNEAVIFAPNHQNGLDDPLAMLLTSSAFQPVFLARADIFKNKLIARLLNLFKISPIYRIRDGKDSLDKNKEVFDNSVRILSNNKMLCLFPEARHIGMKSMLPHKKAISRIVFIAARQTNFELDINIVPVGINYSHYYNFRRGIVVNYGKPIKSSTYYKAFEELGESKASSMIRDDLYEALKDLVVHVPDKEMYKLYEQGFGMYGPLACKKLGLGNYKKNFYKCEKFITQKLDNYLSNMPRENAEKWLSKANEYERLKNRLQLNDNELEKGKASVIDIFTVGLPALIMLLVGLGGAIAHAWLFYLTRYPYRKLIKDKQFYSSVSITLSLVFYPLWFIGLFFILNAIIGVWYFALIALVLSVPLGILAWESGQSLIALKNRMKMSFLFRNKNKHMLQLAQVRKDLMTFFDKVMA